MSGHLTLGVDPGASGALALLFDDGLLALVVDMPAHEGVVSAPLIADALDGVNIGEAWVEAVGAMPKQGVSSSFKFGRAYGTALGVLGALRIPTHLVSPAKWKRAAGLSRDKGASRRRAIELWPDHADLFARVKDDGRAEAALIARHGWQQTARPDAGAPTEAPRQPWDFDPEHPNQEAQQ